jgi:ABC-type antimicrobial peptide transport system permease subunit
VVGIVGHVKQTDVASDSGKGTYYFDLYQKPVEQSAFVLRNNGDAGSLLNAIRSTVQSVDSAQPVYDAKTMDQRVDFALAPQRLVVTLLGAFAAIALFLSALGLYGIISYTVAQRTQEIGVRMALGARSSEVQRSVVGQGMQLALAGVVAGSLIAWVLARSLPSLLYEVRASDPISFVATVIMLIAVAVFASWLPARAAARVDPATALRYE